MATIVRIKRRINEKQPSSLICSKKQKLEDNVKCSKNDTSSNSVFKFAGTISEKDKITTQVRNAMCKEDLQKYFKTHEIPSFKEEIKYNKLSTIKHSRYKILSEKRAIDLDKLDENCTDYTENTKYLLVTLETDTSKDSKESNKSDDATIFCNGTKMIRESQDENTMEYVYDLYFCDHANNMEEMFNFEDIRPIFNDVFLNEYRHGEESDEDNIHDDEDDSNDENNFRNDYPDEDPHFYDPEFDDDDYNYLNDQYSHFDDSEITNEMKNWTVQDYSLSTDDEENEFPKNSNVLNDYENYKKRVTNELNIS